MSSLCPCTVISSLTLIFHVKQTSLLVSLPPSVLRPRNHHFLRSTSDGMLSQGEFWSRETTGHCFLVKGGCVRRAQTRLGRCVPLFPRLALFSGTKHSLLLKLILRNGWPPKLGFCLHQGKTNTRFCCWNSCLDLIRNSGVIRGQSVLHLLCPSHPSGAGRMEGKVLGEESVSSDKIFYGLETPGSPGIGTRRTFLLDLGKGCSIHTHNTGKR